MRLYFFTFLLSLLCFPALSAEVDRVIVLKAQKRMLLVDSQNQVIKNYRVALGAEPLGHKTQQGDEKTPEGRYTLDWIKDDSQFHRAFHVSYPNANDKSQAARKGHSPGGAIFIHGLPNQIEDMAIPVWAYPVHYLYNWTDGCIAVTNKEMDEIIDLVQVGTPIFIFPY